MIESFFRTIKKVIPKPVFAFFQPAYHCLLATLSACVYRFPARHIRIVAVTGTKGKSSVVELVSSILEASGEKTALLNTIRFKIGDVSTPNLYKMSVPGRFFVQHFIRKAVRAGCTWVVLEMTSEGAKQFRHKYLSLDSLIFTNLTPEHIESHGSFEKYRSAKLSIARELKRSRKKDKLLVVNGDSPESHHFTALAIDKTVSYSKKDAEHMLISDSGIECMYKGVPIHSSLRGEFNLENILGAVTWARVRNIQAQSIAEGVARVSTIDGRLQKIECGQSFEVYVDYAHTPESLEAVYKTFSKKRKICVLGSAGGGRDTSRREKMGALADTYCDHIIVTDEDPYDDSPQNIIDDVARGVTKHTPEKILDRRVAIARALSLAGHHDVVLITGKGTDPYIMRSNGTKEPWSDAEVSREELSKLLTVPKN